MFRAINGALALLLTILVLKLALPEVATLLVEIMVKALHMLSAGMDLAAQGPQL